jgi:hypothetical protein
MRFDVEARPLTVTAVLDAYGKTDAVVEVAVNEGATAAVKTVRLVVVADVVVAFVAMRLVAVRLVIVASVAVNVSMIPVVKRERIEKSVVDVALPAVSEDEY